MRSSSISMSETRSKSSVVTVCVFSMIGGVWAVFQVLALRLEEEAMDLTFLMIEDIVDSDGDNSELIVLFVDNKCVTII